MCKEKYDLFYKDKRDLIGDYILWFVLVWLLVFLGIIMCF